MRAEQLVQRPVHGRVLHEDAEDLGATGGRSQVLRGGDLVELGDDDRDVEGHGPGADHAEGLGEDRLVDEEHRVGWEPSKIGA